MPLAVYSHKAPITVAHKTQSTNHVPTTKARTQHIFTSVNTSYPTVLVRANSRCACSRDHWLLFLHKVVSVPQRPVKLSR